MISAMLCAVILSGPCDGGQCRAILPRHVVSVTVEAIVKAPAKVVKVVKRPAKVVKKILPPYRKRK